MKHVCVVAFLTACLCPLPAAAVQAAGPEADDRAQSGNPAPYQPRRYGQSAPASYPSGPRQDVPPELTIPAGTLVTVRVAETVSSDRNRAGDEFIAVLDQPVVVQGWVAARRGQTAAGLVAEAQKAGRVQGVSRLSVELIELALVDGTQVPVRTQLIRASAGPSRGQDAGAVAATTGLGAMVGAAAGGGTGAAIGAAAGAAAGVAGVLTTRGRATEIYPETLLTFRLEAPVTIFTQRSRQAFRPVTQQDYAARDTFRTPGRANYPPPPGYGPYPPGYPAYYGSFGYVVGPRIYAHPGRKHGRGHQRRRFH